MQYAYLLAPTDDPDNPQFLVDADVLDYNASSTRGEKLPEGESSSHFNQPYDVADIPLLKKALADVHDASSSPTSSATPSSRSTRSRRTSR